MSKADKNWKNKAQIAEVEAFDFNLVKEGEEVSVAEVIPGDEIILTWTRSGRIDKTMTVKDRVPCPGGNGMHVHLNRSNCYDSRAKVWVR